MTGERDKPAVQGGSAGAGNDEVRGPSRAPVISIIDQINEVGREIRQRERVYPKWIEAGRYKPETAAKKLADMHAALRSLQWLRDNQYWIRGEFERRQAEAAHEAERAQRLAEAEDWPETQAAKSEFPGATVTGVRDIDDETTQPSQGALFDADQTEPAD